MPRLIHRPQGPFVLNQQSPQARGLAAWWPFMASRGSAGPIRDLTHGYNAAQNNSPMWVTHGEMGQGLRFIAASSQYLNTLVNPFSESVPPFTMAAWVRYIGDGQTSSYCLSLDIEGIDIALGYAAFSGWRGKIHEVELTDWAEPDDNIHHLALVSYSLTDHRLFRDGKEVDSSSSAITLQTPSKVELGRRVFVLGEYWEGDIYSAAVWNYALSYSKNHQLYDPATRWDLYKPLVPTPYWQVTRDLVVARVNVSWVEFQVPAVEEKLTEGTTAWGDTGAAEANVRTFSGNWTGTGTISGTGDAEIIELKAGEYEESEVVNLGTGTAELLQNYYDNTGDDVVLKYRHGTTETACLAASWNVYSTPFESLGYVQVRIESTL